MHPKAKTALIYCLPFLVAFSAMPLTQLEFLQRAPGAGIGDEWLNAYFLEHVWQVLIGRAESFVHLPIFAPNLWVVAFSDNHWGTAIVYVLWRALGFDSIASFQMWWLTAYVANFAAALIAFRLLRLSPVAAMVGAMVFTFALPVTAHSYMHAQLSYRFGAPLALAFYIRFLLDGNARAFLLAVFFTVWQTYASIYIGFFTLISLLFVTLGHLRFFFVPRASRRDLLTPAFSCLKDQSLRAKLAFWMIFLGLFALFCCAFVPYLIPRDVYGSGRSIGEIFTMLPRVASYFYTQTSTIWTMSGPPYEVIPMRHEHQMFIGAAGMIMVVWGAFRARHHTDFQAARLLWVPLVAIIIVTLNADGVSLWIFFAHLPLASAIRAMTRIDLIMLFFAAGLIAILVDQAIRKGLLIRGLLCIGLAGLAVETFKVRTSTTDVAYIEEIRAQDVASVGFLPPDTDLLFVSQTNNDDIVGTMPWFSTEVRAMWLGLALGIPVVNGYSGKFPPGADPWFGDDCTEASRRIISAYRSWPELETQRGPMPEALDRLHLVGFPSECSIEDVLDEVANPHRESPLPESVASHIKLRFLSQDTDGLTIEITNMNDTVFVPMSHGVDKVKLSWRWPDAELDPKSWAPRGRLSASIAPKESITAQIPVTLQDRIDQGRLEISLVQEGVFWFHDKGMETLMVPRPIN